MTVTPSATVPKHSVGYWMCFGVILVVAVLFRLVPIGSGLPYSDYVDEGHVLHQTIDAYNNKSLDAYWYGLPTLPAYAAGAALFLYGPIYRHFHGHRFQNDLPKDRSVPSSKFNYDLIAPVELLVIGRALTVCISVATVVLAGIVAKRLSGARAGLVAMLFVAVCPALVTRSSIVIVDTFAAFFALAVVYYCVRIGDAESEIRSSKFEIRNKSEPSCSNGPMGRREEAAIEPDGPQARGYSDPLFAGFATGLVFASKYPVAAVGVVLLTLIVSLSLSWGRRLQLIVLAGLGIVCGIFVGEPMLFIKPGAVWRDVVENVRAYSSIPSAQGYWAQAISMSELGWPLLLIGAAGIVLMLRGRNTRIIGTSWILFGALLAVLYANSSFRPFRTFLSLVPLVCIAGAIAVSWMIDWAGKDANHRGLRIWIPILLIAGIAGALGYSSFRQVAGRMAHRDSRLRAIDWLCDHTEKGDKVLAIRELAFLPSEWHRVKTDGAIPSLSDLDALEQTPFDYVVTSEFDLRHATEPAVWSGYIERLKRLTADFEVAAEFGRVPAAVVPFVWRTNDERIIILRRRPRADG